MANLPRIAALARFHGLVAFIWLWRWLFWRLTFARPSFVHDLLASSRLRSPDSDASGVGRVLAGRGVAGLAPFPRFTPWPLAFEFSLCVLCWSRKSFFGGAGQVFAFVPTWWGGPGLQESVRTRAQAWAT